MKPKGKHEGPLKINMKFDEAISRALTVKPPSEGWPEYEKQLRRLKKRARRSKKVA